MVPAQFDYVLAAGCSWTKGHRGHMESMPKSVKQFAYQIQENSLWPNILANYLGVDCVNLGKAGAGNQHIHDTIKEHLIGTKGKPLVCVLWTDATRFALPSGMTLRPQRALACNDKKPYGPDSYDRFWQQKDNNLFLNLYIDKFMDIPELVNQSYLLYYSLQRYCEMAGIPYMAAQGLHMYHPTLEHTRDRELERKMRNQMRYWTPRYKSRVNIVSKNMKEELIKHKLLDETHHPSVDGHEYIANRFYESVP